MKIASMLSIALGMLAASQAGAADIGSRKELGAALERALQCKEGAADAFDARDRQVRQHLARLGVQVAGDIDEGPWDFKYTFPAEVSVFGHAVKHAAYSGDSGSLFLVEIAGDAVELAKLKEALRLQPIPSAQASQYANGATYYRPVRAPSKDDPYPDSITAGLQHRDGVSYVVIACETFDY